MAVPRRAPGDRERGEGGTPGFSVAAAPGASYLTGHLGYAQMHPSGLNPAFELDAGDPTALEASRFQVWGEWRRAIGVEATFKAQPVS